MDSENSQEEITILRKEFKDFQEELESRYLQLEYDHTGLIFREFNQRYRLRWWGLVIGGVSLVFMGGVLAYYLFCQPLLLMKHNSWTLVVAPIASITVVTTALIASTFYEGKSLDKITKRNLDRARDGATAVTNLPIS